MTIGEKIIEIRGYLGLSQKELSRIANITQAAICQYETNKRTPDLRSFIQICKALNIKYDKFLENVEL